MRLESWRPVGGWRACRLGSCARRARWPRLSSGSGRAARASCCGAVDAAHGQDRGGAGPGLMRVRGAAAKCGRSRARIFWSACCADGVRGCPCDPAAGGPRARTYSGRRRCGTLCSTVFAQVRCRMEVERAGVSAASPADGDLVRTAARLNRPARQPNLALAATPGPPGPPEVHAGYPPGLCAAHRGELARTPRVRLCLPKWPDPGSGERNHKNEYAVLSVILLASWEPRAKRDVGLSTVGPDGQPGAHAPPPLPGTRGRNQQLPLTKPARPICRRGCSAGHLIVNATVPGAPPGPGTVADGVLRHPSLEAI